MSRSGNRTNGLVAVLEGSSEDFEPWVYPGSTVTLSAALGKYQARVGDRVRGQESEFDRVSIEIPDFVPANLGEWCEPDGDVVLEWEGVSSCMGVFVEARVEPLSPLESSPFLASSSPYGDKVILDLRRDVFSALDTRSAWESHRELLEAARGGGVLGRRDRALCAQALSGSVGGWTESAGAVLNGVFAGIAFDGDGEGRFFDYLVKMFSSSNTWFETPCSGIWKRTARLFPWLEGGEPALSAAVQVGPDGARKHLTRLFGACGLTRASSLWDASRVYTLNDLLSEEEEGANEAALEAFLYVWGATEFDKPALSVARRSEATDAGAGGSATRERDGAITDAPAGVKTDVVVREPFADASAVEILAALQPEVPDAAVSRLTTLIRGAQTSPPADRASFVAEFNEALDALNLRIRIDGGEELARLKFIKTSKAGSIQLGLSGRSRGLRGVELEVVRVAGVSRRVTPSQTASP
ncbi:MAG: hypothetical protein V3W41_01615 [Planctomycetota bacterium]